MTIPLETLDAVSTPAAADTRIGELRFPDGVPDAATANTVYDHLDLVRGIDAFLHSFQGVSMFAIRRGFREAGVADGDVLLFSGLMDSHSLFLTGNADTVYFLAFVDLSDGPLVFDAPPGTLGLVNDMWFRWVIDVGLPGPDRGEGGRFLLVGPDYDGLLPQGGFHVARSTTNGVCLLCRAFMEDSDPAPTVARIKQDMKIYPYEPGTFGTSIGSFLAGDAPLKPLAEPDPPEFIEGTGKVMNTLPPNDFSFYELLDELVQAEPASALDPEIAGHARSIGIVKGQKFKPDDRMRKILDEAAALGNATARTISTRARAEEGFAYYDDDPDSSWFNPLFAGGYSWMDPPPEITPDGVKPYPFTGARAFNSRIGFYYIATGDSPSMCMRLTGIGSQYLMTFLDSKGEVLDGANHYRMTLPPDIPAQRFWSITVYDNQTRSMLQTDQDFPRAGSQSFPSAAAAAEADGSTTIHFSPDQPDGVDRANWIQTVPDKGWFPILRCYSPKASFFDKSWRPGEVEPVD
jgi:hypothetical protein